MKKSGVPWFGVILIVLGIVLLLRKLYILDIHFSMVLWAILGIVGFVGVVKGFSDHGRGRVFWSTVLFLFGLFFFLRSIDLMSMRGFLFMPATFLILSIAFIMTFLSDVHEWYWLIPAAFLGVAGTAFVLADFGYLYMWDVWDVVRTYWPAVLILLGVSFLFRRRSPEPPLQSPQ